MQGIMRSLGRDGDMGRWFWVSLLLADVTVTGSQIRGTPCLSQPNKTIWMQSGQPAVLRCTVGPQCLAKSRKEYKWFAFKGNGHHLLDLEDKRKYSLDGASLHIRSPSVNDSGIYYCAVEAGGQPAPGRQHVGPGTALVVVTSSTKLGHLLLKTFLGLLAFYSVALIILIILQKCGWNKGLCRRTASGHTNKSFKTERFHNVLQELHSRRNFEQSEQTASRNGAAEVAGTQASTSTDDIYQNV